MGVSQNYGYLFGSLCNKGYNILGFVSRPPNFRKLPYDSHLFGGSTK